MRRMGLRVWVVTLMMTAAFGLYEVLKRWWFPDMAVAVSHALSTGVMCVLTLVAARYVVRRYQTLVAATERTNHLLQAVLGAMREGVLIVNPDRTVEMYNPALAGIFHLSDPAPGPRRLLEVTGDATLHEAFRAAIDEGRRSEHQVKLAAPEERTFQAHVTPLPAGERGAPLGAVGVLFDITPLERLEKVRREFFANLSHELRTPLTSILAYVETLLDGAIADPDNNVAFLRIIQKHARRMQELARDIADLSEVESGKIRLQLDAVELGRAVEDTLAVLAAPAEAAGVTLHGDVPAHLVVRADPYRLEQILRNLVENAIKFNRKGGAVRVGAYQEDGATVVLSVEDTGVGIAPADRTRIFERFYRVDKSRSREMGGSGLGLAIVKHLVQAHGGHVAVESTPNRGSTFKVTLPAADQRMKDEGWPQG